MKTFLKKFKETIISYPILNFVMVCFAIIDFYSESHPAQKYALSNLLQQNDLAIVEDILAFIISFWVVTRIFKFYLCEKKNGGLTSMI